MVSSGHDTTIKNGAVGNQSHIVREGLMGWHFTLLNYCLLVCFWKNGNVFSWILTDISIKV